MSESNGNKPPPPPPKVANPYAKKISASTSLQIARSTTNNNNNNNRNDLNRGGGGGGLQVVDIGASASFSQAFSSVEDTSHFRTESETYHSSRNGDNAPMMKERSQQRTFDTNAAAATLEQERLEARDHHVLLQPHVLYVSTKQRGNGVLNFIRNVPFQYSTMVPDYILSSQRCALFLSIKYHNLHPDYIHRRIAELKTDFKLRILLVLVDVEDNANALLQLNKIAVVHSLTLILAWTEEEAARYLETYKAFDGKDATMIQKKEQTNFVDQVADVLGTIRSVNKTDSAQLLSQFGSIKAVMAASVDELVLCPGVGEKKVRRMFEAFHKPFSSKRAKQRKEEAEKANDEHVDDDTETATIPEVTENSSLSTDKRLLDGTTNLSAEIGTGTMPPTVNNHLATN
jgi:DNA excision repair protein ERCC-1